MTSIYDFTVNNIKGEPVSLRTFEGQVLLIVNVASYCGFTPQYAQLETLYRQYKKQHFSVLGFPCNQFGEQEPDPEPQIQLFCETNYHISFPLFQKIDVNGDNTHPLYQFLKSNQKGILGTEAIKWNFTKFLINRQGEVLLRFAPQTNPLSIETDIKRLL